MSDAEKGYTNWVSNVKHLLDRFDFSDVFYNLDSRQSKLFPPVFRQRVIDCFIQDWHGSVERSFVLNEYQYLKLNLNMKST